MTALRNRQVAGVTVYSVAVKSCRGDTISR